jgi:hypothetical protein
MKNKIYGKLVPGIIHEWIGIGDMNCMFIFLLFKNKISPDFNMLSNVGGRGRRAEMRIMSCEF